TFLNRSDHIHTVPGRLGQGALVLGVLGAYVALAVVMHGGAEVCIGSMAVNRRGWSRLIRVRSALTLALPDSLASGVGAHESMPHRPIVRLRAGGPSAGEATVGGDNACGQRVGREGMREGSPAWRLRQLAAACCSTGPHILCRSTESVVV